MEKIGLHVDWAAAPQPAHRMLGPMSGRLVSATFIGRREALSAAANFVNAEPRSPEIFTFHRPETHREWLQQAGYEQSRRALPGVAESPAPYEAGATLRARLKTLPPLMTDGLWPPQITAIENLEASLAQNKPRALIQMATGSGKTFTAANFTYRLAKFAKAKRIQRMAVDR